MDLMPTTRLAGLFATSPSSTVLTTTRRSARWSSQPPYLPCSASHQLDVTPFFMVTLQPSDSADPSAPDSVCLLQMSLYGLKQAPRAWHQWFASYICNHGFTAVKSDTSLYL
jgi:hypothetical protein